MNVVNLIGRLTRDVELKFGQSGKSYSRFSLAVKRAFSKDEVDFINCVAFGKTAEIIGEHVKKGEKLAIEGNLRINSYESNGEKKTSCEVYVNNITFLESKSNPTKDSAPKKENFTPKSLPTPDLDTSDEFPF